MPAVMNMMCMVNINDMVYVLGGYQGSTMAGAFKYNVTGNVWTAIVGVTALKMLVVLHFIVKTANHRVGRRLRQGERDGDSRLRRPDAGQHGDGQLLHVQHGDKCLHRIPITEHGTPGPQGHRHSG